MVLPDPLVVVVSLVSLESLGLMDPRDPMVLLGDRDCQDQKESKVFPVTRVFLVVLELRVL